MSEYDEGAPNEDPDLKLVPKARHRSRGEGRLPRVTQDLPKIPGVEYYSDDELRVMQAANEKTGPNGTGIVSNEHLQEEDLDAFTQPDDLKNQGIDIDPNRTPQDNFREQLQAKRRQVEQAASPVYEPMPQVQEVPFLDKVRGQARMQTGDLDIHRANELMRLKHLEQRVLGDNQFMSATEYDENRKKQVQAEVEADRLNRLRPKVQEEQQEQPGLWGRIARRLRGNQ